MGFSIRHYEKKQKKQEQAGSRHREREPGDGKLSSALPAAINHVIFCRHLGPRPLTWNSVHLPSHRSSSSAGVHSTMGGELSKMVHVSPSAQGLGSQDWIAHT